MFDAIKVIFKQNIRKDPEVAILGVIPVGIEGRDKRHLLQILLTAALKCITIKWLKSDPPTYTMWTEKIWEIYQNK